MNVYKKNLLKEIKRIEGLKKALSELKDTMPKEVFSEEVKTLDFKQRRYSIELETLRNLNRLFIASTLQEKCNLEKKKLKIKKLKNKIKASLVQKIEKM